MTDRFDPKLLVQASALQSLRAMYEDLDRWRARSGRLEEPQPGSDLSRDTAVTHGLGVPLHDLVRHPLISGTQHLNLARTSVEARQVFPIAHPTALRGALLGSARGVWLLSPSDPDLRRVRAARVAAEMHLRLREWIREPENDIDPSVRAHADDVISARYDEQWDRKEVRTLRYTDTGVIKEAGETVFSDPHQQGAVVALWRQLSGDAHGLLWTTMTRASTTKTPLGRNPRYPLRMTQMTSGGDLHELVDAFSAAYRILKVGWSLFDQRCTSPEE